MASAALRSVLYFRTYQTAAIPFYAAIVDDLCASPDLPFELATTLEDIGQRFMELSEEVNAELIRRGVLDHEADAEDTVEAKIERTVQDLLAAVQTGQAPESRRALAILANENVQHALRTALVMTHDLPRAPAN